MTWSLSPANTGKGWTAKLNWQVAKINQLLPRENTYSSTASLAICEVYIDPSSDCAFFCVFIEVYASF